MRRGNWLGAFAGLALAAGLSSVAHAQDPAPPSSGWTYDGGFYAWALWLEGDATARGLDFDVYADPIQLIEALDGPIVMANFEAKRGRFAFYADIVYAEFGLDSDFAAEAEPIPALQLKGDGRIGSDLDFGVYQADAFYQIANFAGAKGNTTIELGAGARYVEMDLTVKGKIDASAGLRLGSLLDRLESRINRIQNQEDRLQSLAQLNALRKELLQKRIVRAKDKGLNRRVARLEKKLKSVDNRGEAIAALEAFDKFRAALLQNAINLDGRDIRGDFAFVETGNMEWIDPVVALRMTHELGNGRSVTALGDFGGFNVDDGLSWQAVLAYNYDGTLFGFDTTTTLGYKALWLKYEDQTSKGARGIDVVLHGPIAEIAFRW
jgi:hypothetical protein